MLGKRCFAKVELAYRLEDVKWLGALSASVLGQSMKAVSFSEKRHPCRYTVKNISRSDFSALRDIEIVYWNGEVRLAEKIVSRAMHLETLKLKGGLPNYRWGKGPKANRALRGLFTRDSHRIDVLFKIVNSDRLARIDLTTVIISAKKLFGILERHCDTITTLNLSCCTIVNGTWPILLRWIQANLTSLQSLQLSGLYAASKQHVSRYQTRAQAEEAAHWAVSTFQEPSKLEFVGTENVRAGLVALLAEHTT